MDKSIERKIAHTVNGHTFPVVELLHISVGRSIPLLSIPVMSDERERDLARKGAAVLAQHRGLLLCSVPGCPCGISARWWAWSWKPCGNCLLARGSAPRQAPL